MTGPPDKDEILDAIRRFADSNGGKPPGVSIFIQQTKFRPVGWQRRCARWGDAIMQACFEPNQLTRRYSDDFMLSHLARWTRGFGHFPLWAELRVRSDKPNGFPSAHAYRRYGGRAVVAAALAAWCDARREWDDVRALCAPVAVGAAAAKATVDETELGEGFVYMLRSGRYYKIGRSNSPKKRMQSIGSLLPGDSVAVHAIETDDQAGIERYWHARFADRRKKGEWFLLTPKDVTDFCRRQFM